ncbi:Adenosylcobinamide amidohydrolase [Pseudooceanicola marinus]|uniref:Adenosylcobinamide amidohydrolase n=1 Tax=Pseudooceanicola marinus TaxID=396013 RepID=A0A1X6YCZ4_9RHOB|nr:adenosylcobinamide amidohydrolase [Pseudooceanicola marinus]PJE32957.1 adenosylcobinamide amidohydrolase [Pseudooceanicola marinus]SLN17449.1 Adenosylcobinamide amidohydrolase [Pseudooceanicola marinus]
MSLTLSPPWLCFDLGAPHRVLSWAPYRPGFVRAEQILWREVRNADLPEDLDAHAWLSGEVAGLKGPEAVCFLTSRDIRAHHHRRIRVSSAEAEVVATVGLSNAERVGTRLDRSGTDWGTINVAVRLGGAFSDIALLEAMSIATQARTAAVMDHGAQLPTGIATGTGTDCVAVAARAGENAYAGLHTEIGEAVGRATYDAVLAGATEWQTYWQAHGRGFF